MSPSHLGLSSLSARPQPRPQRRPRLASPRLRPACTHSEPSNVRPIRSQLPIMLRARSYRSGSVSLSCPVRTAQRSHAKMSLTPLSCALAVCQRWEAVVQGRAMRPRWCGLAPRRSSPLSLRLFTHRAPHVATLWRLPVVVRVAHARHAREPPAALPARLAGGRVVRHPVEGVRVPVDRDRGRREHQERGEGEHRGRVWVLRVERVLLVDGSFHPGRGDGVAGLVAVLASYSSDN